MSMLPSSISSGSNQSFAGVIVSLIARSLDAIRARDQAADHPQERFAFGIFRPAEECAEFDIGHLPA